MKNKRVTSKNKRRPVVVAVSGGFDPIHIGHIRMFFAAKKLGDKLVVIINNDNWMRLKKGYSFMNEKERKAVIEALKPVDRVMLTDHKVGTKDMSVCTSLQKLKPDIFANGGDRKAGNIPEYELCHKLGIKMTFNVGAGGKVQSSSWLIKKAADEAKKKSR
jgi:cytidyltransferase-like protein